MWYILLLAFYLSMQCTAVAQNARLEVFKIDSSQFPLMKAKFYALDNKGKLSNGFSQADFIISENDTKSIVKNVTWAPPKPKEDLSVIISLCTSYSMGYSDKGFAPPLEIGKAFTTKFSQTTASPLDQLALQTINDKAMLNVDFTTDRNRILRALPPLEASGDFNSGYQFSSFYPYSIVNPIANLPSIAKEAWHRRVAVMILDGQQSLQHGAYTYAQQLKTENLRLYIIICSSWAGDKSNARSDLKFLAEYTGGAVFDNVTSVEQAEQLAVELQGIIRSEPGEIEWESAAVCEPVRNVSVSLIPLSAQAQLSYIAPEQSLVSLKLTPSSITLGGITPGGSKDTTITISALNSSINITDITLSSEYFSIIDFGGTPPPFVLQKDEGRLLKVRFSPKDSLRISALLSIENSACAQTAVYFGGGFPDQALSEQTLRVVYPNAEDTLVAGSDTTLRWEGLPRGDAASVEYTLDNGKTWQVISQQADSLSYKWKIPNTASNQGRIRVRHYPNSAPAWAKITKEKGRVTSLLVDKNGNIYTRNNSPNNYTHYSDLHIIKYSGDGTILWEKKILSGYGSSVESSAMALDSSGNIYITGFFPRGSIAFGDNVTLNSDSPSNFFLAKINSLGIVQWAKKAGCGSLGSFVYRSELPVSTDKNGNIWVAGSLASDSLIFETGQIIRQSDPELPSMFVACYNNAGVLKVARNIASGSAIPKSIAVDYSGNVLIHGVFSSPFLEFRNNRLTNQTDADSEWLNDVFLSKFEPDGNAIWATGIGGESDESAGSMTFDESGNVYVAGIYSSATLDFGGMAELSNTGNRPCYFAKYNVEGKILWSRNLAGTIGYEMSLLRNKEDIYLAGTHTAYSDFGNGVLMQGRNDDIFIAKFYYSGITQWARNISGASREYMNAFTSDRNGNIYLSGWSESIALNFSGGMTLKNTNYPSERSFLAKYINLTHEQSDISDKAFAIVKPQATFLTKDIDLGRMYNFRDSVVRNIISNIGKYPFYIRYADIGYLHSSKLLSGHFPGILQPGEKRTVAFRFEPYDTGMSNTILSVGTQSYEYNVSVKGEKFSAPVNTFHPFTVDFGPIGIGIQKDTVITIATKTSADQKPVNIRAWITGTDAKYFTIITPDTIRLSNEQRSASISIRYRPEFVGRSNARLVIEYSDDVATGRSSTDLYGRGRIGHIALSNDSAYKGETRNIKLTLTNYQKHGSERIHLKSFRAQIAYANYFFQPDTDLFKEEMVLKRGNTVDTIEINQMSDFSSDVLAQIPLKIIAGDKISPEIHIVSCSLQDSTGRQFETTHQNGVFTILGELPDPKQIQDNPVLEITPNPAKEIASASFKTFKEGSVRISITDVLGRRRMILEENILAGEHNLEFNTKEFGHGSYVLTLETDGQFFSKKILIVR
ncbi:MAG TPA: choice-of-anchor D domain-containing protein [Patescibacteria group bacterium]|nr:choice-of-anchor D domain-containing protein [Patescibacteria group bacterium]